jgi:hypothetical protein
VRGSENAIQSLRGILASVEESSVFQSVVSVPLSPFRALEGVGDSAAGIREFNGIARSFARSVERLPEQMRWQVELLMFEIEDRDTVRSVLAALQSLASSADRLSGSAESLPSDVRALLQDSSQTLAQLQQLVASGSALAEPLRDASQHVEQASASWQAILGPRDGAEARPRGRPFDVREWESAVREVGATAQELESLLREVRTTADARPGSAALVPFNAALDRADGLTRAWIDLLAWRLAELMLAGVALALVYRLIVARLPRR